MPVNLASPGIKVREVDLTVGRVDPSSANIGGLVAPFAQGPVDLPLIIGSEKDLLDNFGKPYNNDKHYEHWLTASSYLAYGAQMSVVRADSDNLANAYANVGSASSIKIKSIEDYEIKQYDENPIANKAVVARNPGSWANGIRIGIIDSRADQIVGVSTVTGISIGDGVKQQTSLFTEDNVIIGEGTTTPLTGEFKGIVTDIDAAKNEIHVKFVSHVVGTTETVQDYTYSGTYRFRQVELSLVGAGAGTTSVALSGRGSLGSSAASIGVGTAVNSYFLESTHTLDMQGGVSLFSALSSLVLHCSYLVD